MIMKIQITVSEHRDIIIIYLMIAAPVMYAIIYCITVLAIVYWLKYDMKAFRMSTALSAG